MRAEDLLSWVRAAPLVPFRIRLNSGRTFDIRHPEMLRVGRTAANVYSFAGEPGDPYEQVEMISWVLIESVTPIGAGHSA